MIAQRFESTKRKEDLIMRKLIIALAVTASVGPFIMSDLNDFAANAASNLPAASAEVPPLIGANSFTEAQARSQVEGQGFAQVSALVKDNDGVWRGTASKGGATMNVAVDFKGNVVSAAADAAMGTPKVTGDAAADPASGTTKTVETPSADVPKMSVTDAKSKIESLGYTDVKDLTLAEDSQWHATAMKSGNSMKIIMDQKGTIIAN